MVFRARLRAPMSRNASVRHRRPHPSGNALPGPVLVPERLRTESHPRPPPRRHPSEIFYDWLFSSPWISPWQLYSTSRRDSLLEISDRTEMYAVCAASSIRMRNVWSAVCYLRLRAAALALRGPPTIHNCKIVGGHRPPLQLKPVSPNFSPGRATMNLIRANPGGHDAQTCRHDLHSCFGDCNWPCSNRAAAGTGRNRVDDVSGELLCDSRSRQNDGPCI